MMNVCVTTMAGNQTGLTLPELALGSCILTALNIPVCEGVMLKLLKDHEELDLELPLKASGISDGSMLTLVRCSKDEGVAIGYQDGSAAVYSAVTGERRLELLGHWGLIARIEISSDGRSVLTTSRDKSGRLWDISDGRVLQNLPEAGAVASCSFLGGGVQKVLTVSESWGFPPVLKLMSMRTGRCTWVFNNVNEISHAQSSPDGTLMLTVARPVHLWCLETGKQLATLDGHEDRVMDATFSPDSTHVATAGNDCKALLWNVESERPVMCFNGHSVPVLTVAFSMDGRLLLTTGQDGSAKVWRCSDGACVRSFSMKDPGNLGTLRARAVTFSPTDGNVLLVVDTDNSVKIWHLNAEAPLKVLSTGTDEEFLVASFGPDGKKVITVSVGWNVRVWNVEQGSCTAILSTGKAATDMSIGWTNSC